MTPEYLTPVPNREIVGSRAFNLEYLPYARSDQSIKDDIIAYLGEYRFQIPRHEYSLFYSVDDSGSVSLLAQDGETMGMKSGRSVAERSQRGDPVHREKNETLGILNLERQLQTAKDGDTLFWASPPGPKDEGYGDYGYVYKGEIRDGRVNMTALRVENPTIEQYNRAMGRLTGAGFNFKHADEFLRHPLVVSRTISDSFTENVLVQEFNQLQDEEKQREFETAIKVLEPLIDRAIFAIKYGKKHEKLRTFYALENYAIELRDKTRQVYLRERIGYLLDNYDLDQIVASRSYEPPRAAGSCGSTSSSRNMLFSGDSIISSFLTQDKYGDREFKCPKCNMTNIRPIDELLDKCQHCGSTEVACKETTAEEDYSQEAA